MMGVLYASSTHDQEGTSERWSSETVYAITDLSAEEASAAEFASWAPAYRTVENTVHWVRDMVFGEDESQVRTHRSPAILAAVRDLIHSALKVAGYVNTAAGRRAHTERPCVLDLYDITRSNLITRAPPGSCIRLRRCGIRRRIR